jgi:hypothetical protein
MAMTIPGCVENMARCYNTRPPLLWPDESGAAIWSDRFAGEAVDLFNLQDELSLRVVATIAPQVQEAEQRLAEPNA